MKSSNATVFIISSELAEDSLAHVATVRLQIKLFSSVSFSEATFKKHTYNYYW